MDSTKIQEALAVTSEQLGKVIGEVIEEKRPGTVKPEKNMYVGPPTKLLPKYTIYEGGLPEFLDEHLENCPALKALFVEPTKITDAQLQLSDSNSVLSMFYKKVEEYFFNNSEVK